MREETETDTNWKPLDDPSRTPFEIEQLSQEKFCLIVTNNGRETFDSWSEAKARQAELRASMSGEEVQAMKEAKKQDREHFNIEKDDAFGLYSIVTPAGREIFCDFDEVHQRRAELIGARVAELQAAKSPTVESESRKDPEFQFGERWAPNVPYLQKDPEIDWEIER